MAVLCLALTSQTFAQQNMVLGFTLTYALKKVKFEQQQQQKQV